MNILLVFATAIGVSILSSFAVEAQGIGVNYGMLGNDLPTPNEVISLYKSRNIYKLRLFSPNPEVIRAMYGSRIELVVGTRNEDLQLLAQDATSAVNWVEINVLPHVKYVKFRYITAGNEVIPSSLQNYVLLAMKNLEVALRDADLSIPVTTVVSTEVLGVSYPPSHGLFSASSNLTMAPIISFLKAKRYPLLVNVYPYFAFASNTNKISSTYALFTSSTVSVQDGRFGYTNLFDAIVDAMHSALEKIGGSSVKVVVSESGWPSNGGIAATVQDAKIYNNNLVRHVKSNVGTPRRPQMNIEAYLFAMFNENEKPSGVEQNFGLYSANMTQMYSVNF